jgi:AraC family transcriptional regulator
MDWHEKMNAAIDYIEDNLTGKIDIWQAALLASCSEYHFRRMFSFTAGVPVSEYIRRRRMTLAARELLDSEADLDRIARKYGYTAPDAFTRAFRSLHGFNPSQARENLHSLKAWPRMSFFLTIKGGTEMEYRLEEKPEFRIAGIKKRITIQFEGINPEIESMWESLDPRMLRELELLSDMQPSGIINASANFEQGRMDEQGKLDHYIGVATTHEVNDKWACLEVPESLWAVFKVSGPFPMALQDTWGRIYSEWFPSVNYQMTGGPEIMCVIEEDIPKQEATCEIWIPVNSNR